MSSPAVRPGLPGMGNLATGLLGALLLLPVELVGLGKLDARVVWVVVALYAALGLAVGWCIIAAEALVARLRLVGVAAALVRAAPALLALFPLLRHLFDGGYASTLPGAARGHVVVPLMGWVATAVALW